MNPSFLKTYPSSSPRVSTNPLQSPSSHLRPFSHLIDRCTCDPKDEPPQKKEKICEERVSSTRTYLGCFRINKKAPGVCGWFEERRRETEREEREGVPSYPWFKYPSSFRWDGQFARYCPCDTLGYSSVCISLIIFQAFLGNFIV